VFSPEGTFFRSFLLDEVVKSIDALSREQLVLLVSQLGLQVLVAILNRGVAILNRG
jgi:aarF domain-containing kinase